MTRNECITVSNTYALTDSITNAVLSVTFDSDANYKIETDPNNGKLGVLQLINGEWKWSWLNTINTNYTCLWHIIRYLNNTHSDQLSMNLFNSNRKKFVEIFKKNVNEESQILFTPGSDVFDDMQFVTQKTWNDGVVSTISTIYTLEAHQNIRTNRYEFQYHRGDIIDMKDGVDFKILTGATDNGWGVQHKKTHSVRYDSDGFYWFKFRFKETYRKNVDLIAINDQNYVYLFKVSKISYDPKCRFIQSCDRFMVHKDLHQKTMKVENKEITNILFEINRYCCDNRIPFHFISESDSKMNLIEDIIDHGERIIKFTFVDRDDKNLLETLNEFFAKLKNSV